MRIFAAKLRPMKKIVFVLVFLSLAFGCFADHSVSVCGEVDYPVPESQTLNEAKATAITRARVKALADQFGTVVSQTNTNATHNVDGKTSSAFNSYTENDVRGIWIEDTQEPKVESYYEKGIMVLHVEVCGKAREIKTSQVELDVKTLNYGFCNGEENPFRKGYETTQYNDSDFFGVRFQSPVDGYLALLLRDDNTGDVYVQMPYAESDGSARVIKGNQKYVFLNNEDQEFPWPASTILTTERKIEYNTLIVIFSKNPFQIPNSHLGDWFFEFDQSKYQKWLQSLRKHDETVQTKEILLTIKKIKN